MDVVENKRFTSRDMDALLESGGLGMLNSRQAGYAIRAAVDNPVDDGGRPATNFDKAAASEYLLRRYARATGGRHIEAAESVMRSMHDEASALIDASIMDATGVSGVEYGAAKVFRRAGAASDANRIYAKYISLC